MLRTHLDQVFVGMMAVALIGVRLTWSQVYDGSPAEARRRWWAGRLLFLSLCFGIAGSSTLVWAGWSTGVRTALVVLGLLALGVWIGAERLRRAEAGLEPRRGFQVTGSGRAAITALGVLVLAQAVALVAQI